MRQMSTLSTCPVGKTAISKHGDQWRPLVFWTGLRWQLFLIGTVQRVSYSRTEVRLATLIHSGACCSSWKISCFKHTSLKETSKKEHCLTQRLENLCKLKKLMLQLHTIEWFSPLTNCDSFSRFCSEQGGGGVVLGDWRCWPLLRFSIFSLTNKGAKQGPVRAASRDHIVSRVRGAACI